MTLIAMFRSKVYAEQGAMMHDIDPLQTVACQESLLSGSHLQDISKCHETLCVVVN